MKGWVTHSLSTCPPPDYDSLQGSCGKVGDKENIACADDIGSKEHFKIWAQEKVNRPTHIVKESKERVLVDGFIDHQEDYPKADPADWGDMGSMTGMSQGRLWP